MWEDSHVNDTEHDLERSLVAEIIEVLGELHPPSGCEIQLFGYFPLLKLQTLFGSVMIQEQRPQKALPLGASQLLLHEELPDEKLFYPYVVIREPGIDSIKYSYLFPLDDTIEIKSFEVFDDTPPDELLSVEAGILDYALEWTNVYYE